MKRTKPTIGLALGSGGWRGLAHIGVIKSLVKHGFRISGIVGSSSGALIGGLYALWDDIDRVENTFKQLTYKDLLYFFSDPSQKLGLFRGLHTLTRFQQYTHNATIESLHIPFKAVACDLLSDQKYLFESGDLATAIRASGSVPLIFDPVEHDGHVLTDGGIIDPVPATETRKLGVDIVIAVNLYEGIFPIKHAHKLSKIDLTMITFQLTLNELAKRSRSEADIYLAPKFGYAETDMFFHFVNNQHAIDVGETVMDHKIAALMDCV